MAERANQSPHHPDVAAKLDQLFPGGTGFFLAYDQGFEHGPKDFHGDNADPDYILQIAANGHYQGVVLHHGTADKYYPPYQSKVPLLLKLNGKTSLHNDEPLSLAVASVADAVELGAAAVGYTVYVGSEHEPQMLAEFGRIIHDAHAAGLPVFGWMYPRGAAVANPTDPETIAYAARVGLEVGADVVKTYYPGSPEKLAEVVTLAGRTKVVIAGGTRQDPAAFLEQAKLILDAGAAGVAVGRNVWQSDDPDAVSRQLAALRGPALPGPVPADSDQPGGEQPAA